MVSTMSDDVVNEVRRILANNTIDQVISYNATIKKDIQQSHEELRNVVGQRYRDLILACDKVVGMDQVCRQVLTSFKAAEWKKRGGGGGAHPPSAAEAAAAASTSHAATPALEAATVKDAVLANQLQRRLNSVRALTRGHAFLDAALSFRAVQAKLADVGRQSSLYTRLFEPLNRSAEILFRDILSSIRRHIVALGRSGAAGSAAPAILEPYRDLHSALELLHACSPSHALTLLCDLHVQALGSLDVSALAGAAAALSAASTSSAALEKQLLTACGIYFNLLWYCTAAPSIPPGHASTAVPTTLAALASSETSLEALSLQVIGLRVLSQQPQSTASRLDGWALSPATGRPELKIDTDDVAKVQQCAEAAIRALLTEASHTSVDDLRALHATLQAAAAMLARRLDGIAAQSPAASAGQPPALFRAEQWHAIVAAAIDQASKQVLTDLLRTCNGHCASALEAAQATGAQPARADPAASLALSALFTEPSSLFQRSNSFSAAAEPTSPVTPLSPSSRRRATAVDDLREGLVFLSNAVSATAEPSIAALVQEFLADVLNQVSRRIVKAQTEENTPCLFGIAAVVDCFLAAPMLRQAAGPYGRAAGQFERLYVDAHRLWVATVVAEQCSSILASGAASFFAYASSWTPRAAASGATATTTTSASAPDSDAAMAADVRSALASCWTSHTIEGAVVHCPRRSSPGLAKVVLRLQQTIHAARPATRLALVVGALQDAIIGRFVAYYTGLVRNAAGSPMLVTEEALLQMAFDVVFVATAYSDAHPQATASAAAAARQLPPSARQLLAQIEEKVDVVTWSVAYPLLLAAATSAATTSTLCFGLVGCNAAATPSAPASSSLSDAPAFSMAEVDRFPLLPLSTPTQPKPNLAALLSSANMVDDRPVASTSRSVKDASASLLAGATKGLRSVLWGES